MHLTLTCQSPLSAQREILGLPHRWVAWSKILVGSTHAPTYMPLFENQKAVGRENHSYFCGWSEFKFCSSLVPFHPREEGYVCQWSLRLVGRVSSLAVLTPVLPQGQMAWAVDRRKCADARWSWEGLCDHWASLGRAVGPAWETARGSSMYQPHLSGFWVSEKQLSFLKLLIIDIFKHTQN